MNKHSSFGYDEHTNSAQGAQGGNGKQKKSNSEDKTKQPTTVKEHGQNLSHPESQTEAPLPYEQLRFVGDRPESITTEYSEEGHADNIETCFNCGGQLDKGNLVDMRNHMRCRPDMPRPNYQRNEEPSRRTQGPPTQTLFGNNGGYHNE